MKAYDYFLESIVKSISLFLSLFLSLSSFALSDSISCQGLDKDIVFSISQEEQDEQEEIKIFLSIDREILTNLAVTEIRINENSISFGINDLSALKAYTFISSDSFKGHNAKLIDIGESETESSTFKLNCADK